MFLSITYRNLCIAEKFFILFFCFTVFNFLVSGRFCEHDSVIMVNLMDRGMVEYCSYGLHERKNGFSELTNKLRNKMFYFQINHNKIFQ